MIVQQDGRRRPRQREYAQNHERDHRRLQPRPPVDARDSHDSERRRYDQKGDAPVIRDRAGTRIFRDRRARVAGRAFFGIGGRSVRAVLGGPALRHVYRAAIVLAHDAGELRHAADFDLIEKVVRKPDEDDGFAIERRRQMDFVAVDIRHLSDDVYPTADPLRLKGVLVVLVHAHQDVGFIGSAQILRRAAACRDDRQQRHARQRDNCQFRDQGFLPRRVR